MAANSKSKKKLFIFGGLGLLVIVLVLVVLFGSKRENVVTIQTEKATRRTITQIVTASGKIQPETQVKINAEVSGEIIGLPVKEGQRVRRGELLVRIKPDQYQAQVDRADAGLTSSKASLSLQTANLEKAQSEFKRAEELFQKKLTSEQEFISAKTALQVAKSQYESAKAGVAQAQASLRDSKESLAKTSVYSPMDGVVSQLISEAGERVSGSSFMQGTEIMTIADLSMMEARVDIGENDVVMISVGDTARVQVDAYANRKFKGTVSEIANTAKTKGAGSQDEVTNFEVKIRIVDKDVVFRPGMSMSADIETETKKSVLSIPIQSVTTRVMKPKEGEKPKQGDGVATAAAKGAEGTQSEKPKEVVFAVDNGKAKALPVKRGISDDLYVEILDGVTDQLEVVSGSFKAINRDLEDGALVKIDNTQKRFGMAKKEN
ncbi:MAG: efflux RND transporter periplasmic adaptor subunit [Ignavibacteriales bacterium]|nr:efflux RND transporter periplasmic adaptor subunit [Ignavibacteriales bacterium]